MNEAPSDRPTFTRTLLSVLAVQVVSLIILAILQARYGG